MSTGQLPPEIVAPAQTAEQSSIYQKVLSEAESMDFELAYGVDGIDDEIALLRYKIMKILKHDPNNMKVIIDASNSIERLVRTRYKVLPGGGRKVREALIKIFKDVALPVGVTLSNILGKK